MSPSLRFAYNTSGFSNHRLAECLRVLAGLGYDGVSLTPDVAHLDPFRVGEDELGACAAVLAETGLALAIETGARFVLDPWRKHWPTLLSEPQAAARRLDHLRRCLRIGERLGARCLSLWSGCAEPDTPAGTSWDRLCAGLRALLDDAEERGLTLCLEPEPGMFVGDMAGWEELNARLADPRLGLTLDLGHVACTERASIPDTIRRYAQRMKNVHIEDIRGRVHQHLPFGEGALDFPPILAALAEVGYDGLVSVELGRDGHRAPTLARDSLAFLRERFAAGIRAQTG